MTFQELFRKLFGKRKELSKLETQLLFFKTILKFCKAQRVLVLHGTVRNLRNEIMDSNKRVFIVSVDIKNVVGPKSIEQWFKEYKI